MVHNPEAEFYCAQFIKQLEEIAGGALADTNKSFVADAEREELEKQSRYLRVAFDRLTATIFDTMRGSNPTATYRGYEQLRRLLVAAYLIGSHATVTDPGESSSCTSRSKFTERIAAKVALQSGRGRLMRRNWRSGLMAREASCRKPNLQQKLTTNGG